MTKEKNNNPTDQVNVNTETTSPQKEAGKGSKVDPVRRKKLLKTLGIVALVILVLGGISMLVYKNKEYFVVARVNNTFVPRWELRKKLFETYGASVADRLITDKLIRQELKKANVEVSEDALQERLNEVEQQVRQGYNMDLDSYLEQQNIDLADLQEDLRLQLGIEELLADRVDVTEEEVDEFLEQSAEQLPGETEEEKRAEAVNILVDQEIGMLFQQWLQEIRDAAKITNYLE